MFSAIIFFLVVAAACLIGIVLIQNPKGGGLGAGFSSGSANFLGGVQRATDVLEKITWGLFTTIVILCILSVATLDKKVDASGTLKNSEVMERAKENTPAPDFSLPPAGSALPAPSEEEAGQP